MQVVLLASGSRGDVQPYVALGKGLRDAGHGVWVLTSPDFQSLVAGQGLEYVGVGGSVEAVAQSMRALVEGGNMLKILASMGQSAREMSVNYAASGLAAARDADVLVGGLGGLFVGLALSEKLGIPFVQAYLTPLTPTRAFPGVLMPAAPLPLPAWANGLSHRLTQQMLWQNFRAADNEARARVLHLPPAPFWGPFGALGRGRQPVVYGYSPLVVPPPKDWPDTISVTGYWLLDPPAGWEPPADLVNFLQAGPPPVYIGFGSMTGSQPAQTVALVLEALARTGQRGILSAGWGGLRQDDLPPSVFGVGSLPHTWLLPQMAAVVHHGGAGTTGAALRAGVPSIVTPFFGDQPFWGARVHALGVGPRPIPRRRLTAAALADAIGEAVSNPAMRSAAARLGAGLRAENGVARAVAVIAESRKA